MSKKNVHPIVSAAGWITAVVGALLVAVRKLGGELGLAEEQVDERIHLLSTPAGESILTQFAALILGQGQAVVVATAPPDWWERVIAMMIRVCEFVSYINPNITGANFPYQTGDLDPKQVEVISIKQRIRDLGVGYLTTQQVLDYLNSLGYRPARLMELLWWWIMNPTKRANCLVVALGSVWRGLVPCVGGDGSYRGLGLDSVESDWPGRCAFAAVRK